jgi:hypothetical protein
LAAGSVSTELSGRLHGNRRGESVAVAFAPAEQTDRLISWAILDDETGDGQTAYTFSNLKRF